MKAHSKLTPRLKLAISVLVSISVFMLFYYSLDFGKMKIRSGKPVTSVALSADGSLVALGLASGEVVLIDTKTKNRVASITPHGNLVSGLAFHPLKPQLVIAYGNTALDDQGLTITVDIPEGNVVLWDCDAYDILYSTTTEHDKPACVFFSPDGERFIVAGEGKFSKVYKSIIDGEEREVVDHPLNIVNAKDGSIVNSYAKKGSLFWYSAAVSNDWKHIASTGYTATIWSIETGEIVSEMQQGHGVRGIAFLPDANRILLASGMVGDIGTDAAVWDFSTKKQLRVFHPHTMQPYRMLLLATGKDVLSSGQDSMISVWDLETGKRRWGYYTFGYWSEIAASADGSKGAATVRGGVIVFDIPKR